MTSKYIPEVWLKRIFVVLAIYVGMGYVTKGFMGNPSYRDCNAKTRKARFEGRALGAPPRQSRNDDMEMHPVYLDLDPYLIWFYRLTGSRRGGIFSSAPWSWRFSPCWSGSSPPSWPSRSSCGDTRGDNGEAKKYQDLSIEALKAGDRPAYEAANKLANEAFGKSFFSQVALSATFVWPIFFVLAWMQHRFLEVEFPIPGTNWSLGFIGVFIIIYAATYVLFKQTKRRVKVFRLHQRNSVVLQHEPVK